MAAEPRSGPVAGIPTPVLVLIGVLVLVLIGGFVALAIAGRDTLPYALFVGGPLVTSIVGGVLAQRVTAVERVARTVEAQTNGAMSAQFADVHDHLDQQTDTVVATVVATSAPADSRQPAPPAPARRSAGVPEQPAPGENSDQSVGRQTVRRLP